MNRLSPQFGKMWNEIHVGHLTKLLRFGTAHMVAFHFEKGLNYYYFSKNEEMYIITIVR